MSKIGNIIFQQCEEMRPLNSSQYFKGIKPKESFRKKFFENEYLITRLEWVLSRYVGKYHSNEQGTFRLPSKSIAAKYSSQAFLQELNSKNCFEFSYSPSEGDNLQIYMVYVFDWSKGHNRQTDWGHFSFIFRDGIWTEDYYDPFFDSWEEFSRGVVKVTSHNTG